MARDISIMITAKDNFSTAIHTMQGAAYSFNKDMDGMQNKLNSLNKTRSTLQVDTDKARRALKEAQNGYLELGTAAKKSEMEAANADYEQARRNLSLVAKEARETEKAMLSYGSTSSKAENKAGFTGGITGAISELKSNAAFSQMGKMLGDSVSGAMNVGITSMLGSNAGSAISTISSGIMGGAAMGAIAGPVGTAVGAGVGLVSGGLQAATNYFGKKDDAFRGVVQDQYGIQQQRIENDLNAGSSIAAGRAMDEISFSKLMGGKDIASVFLGGIKDMANTTPFQYEDLTQMSKVLSAYKYSPDEIKTLLSQVGDTGAALGMDINGMSAISTGLGRMKSSGKTTLEYINPLIERGIPVMPYLAKANNVSEKEIYDMISKGKLDGTKSAQIIADAMGEENIGAMQAQSETYAGMQSTVEGLKKEAQAAMGTAYNEVRKAGLKEDVEFYGGEEGTKLQDANKLVGQWKGKLENDRNAEIRKAESAALTQFENGEITGSQAGEIIARARVEAEAAYMASEGMQQEIASQKTLVNGIQSAMEEGGVYKEFGMRMGEEFSKGLASVAGEKMMQTFEPSNYKLPTTSSHSAAGSESGITTRDPPNSIYASNSSAPKKAFGMGYVPYNDFPALLHEGERVMTAQENRAYSSGNAPNITITGNNFSVREEADVYAVAKEIARQVERARMLM